VAEAELLLHRADPALYQAKAAGRNRTMRWAQSS
jgi:PleD family two-component response regulator